MSAPQVTFMDPDDLNFDLKNPRLAEYGIDSGFTDEMILDVLWDAMDVRELVQSISASGYFVQEALIVCIENSSKIVIEGNRRLAALKVLIHQQGGSRDGWEIPKISTERIAELHKIPVILSERSESWRYLGFKHVNGPAKWSSYAKAAYIASVNREYGIPLADIANQIGDRHKTVQRLYRGLMVLEQAETSGVFDRENRFRTRLAFSHLYTGLSYDGISSFLDLKPETEELANPVPDEKLKELGELMVWMYGDKRDKRPPIVESQNPDLRRLNAALQNREAIAAIRAGSDLDRAFEISRPSPSVFEGSIMSAKRELVTARAHLTTGYDKSEALLKIAGSVAELADDVYEEMKRKRIDIPTERRITED